MFFAALHKNFPSGQSCELRTSRLSIYYDNCVNIGIMQNISKIRRHSSNILNILFEIIKILKNCSWFSKMEVSCYFSILSSPTLRLESKQL